MKNLFLEIKDVQKALKEAGVENSNLIIGVDYTGSNVSKYTKPTS